MHVGGVVLKGFWDGVAIDVDDVKARNIGRFAACVAIGARGREEDRF